jgi:hypothetical protein
LFIFFIPTDLLQADRPSLASTPPQSTPFMPILPTYRSCLHPHIFSHRKHPMTYLPPVKVSTTLFRQFANKWALFPKEEEASPRRPLNRNCKEEPCNSHPHQTLLVHATYLLRSIWVIGVIGSTLFFLKKKIFQVESETFHPKSPIYTRPS